MPDHLIRDLFSKTLVPTPDVPHDMPYKILVGVEIEMENVENASVPTGWSPHADGSLRNGLEFVFSRPMNGLEMYKTVSAFYDAKLKFSAGPRTSTHIHVDMTDATLSQARAMFALIYTIENALFGVVEENRKWTGYCMPLAEMSPQKIRAFMTATNLRDLLSLFGGRNPEKYYGFNIQSMKKHGTVELRYFTGGPTKEELLSWIVFCNELKAMSKAVSLKNILDIDNITDLERLLLLHFPVWGPKLLRGGSLESMLDSLNEIAGLLEEDTGPSRTDTLVFITPTLTTYFYNTLLVTPQKKKAFQDTLANMSVLSYSEFHNTLVKILQPWDDMKAPPPEYDEDDDAPVLVTRSPDPATEVYTSARGGGFWIDESPSVDLADMIRERTGRASVVQTQPNPEPPIPSGRTRAELEASTEALNAYRRFSEYATGRAAPSLLGSATPRPTRSTRTGGTR